MKTNIKIIIAIILIFAGIVLFEQHKDAERAEYAQAHNCTWVVAGSHDICK
jgi:hypothetical protein